MEKRSIDGIVEEKKGGITQRGHSPCCSQLLAASLDLTVSQNKR